MKTQKPFGPLSCLVHPVLVVTLALSGCKGSGGDVGGMGGGGASGDGDAPAGDPGLPSRCDADSDCDDGVFCNGREFCDEEVCRRGRAVDCDDGVDCTVDRCVEADEACVSEPKDDDGDGHASADCLDGDGEPLGDDCDDDDAFAFPGNVEVCDPDHRDEDCDPKTIGNRDSDNDGYVDQECCNEQEDGDPLCGEDCDDYKPNVSPESTEVCDYFDNDCDGKVDEDVSVPMYPDKDHDGHGDMDAKPTGACPGAVAYALVADDCDDSDPEVFLGQFEICDDKDNNCDGNADEIEEQAPWFADVDGDGYGDPDSTPVFSCYRVTGRVLSQNDCDDTENKVNPNATEICDGRDNDCNGLSDFRLSGINDFEDDDRDGVADASCGGDDCDDRDARTAGGAQEVCDYIDNDCDGLIDEQTVQNIWYVDEDGDGWGVVVGSAVASCDPLRGRASQFGDCDDSSEMAYDVHPGSTEYCDGVDNDCDGVVDEGAAVHCKLDNAVSSCNSGACRVFTCTPGFADVDKDAENGCEAPVNLSDRLTGVSCSTNSNCDNGLYCDGNETCYQGECLHGTPVDCSSSTAIIQGDVTIMNGQDLDRMRGVEVVTGSLHIDSTPLISLVGLESLRVVGGELTITYNPNLKKLSGSALSGLVTVGGGIYVQGNDSLIDADLPSLVSAGSLNIEYNYALKRLEGFDSLVTLDTGLRIYGNSILETIDAFGALSRVGGMPDSSSCYGGGVWIEGQSNLAELNAFGALTDVGGGVCLGEHALETLSLSKLRHVGGTLLMFNAPELSDLDLPQLEAVDESIIFGGGEGAPPELTSLSLPALETTNSLEIHGAGDTYEVIDFPSLREVSGGLYLDLTTTLTHAVDLDLNALERLGGAFIYGGPNVTDWTFPSLERIDGVFTMYTFESGIESIAFPELTSANQLNLDNSSPTLRSVALPKLADVEYLYVFATSPGFDNLGLGSLVKAGQIDVDLTSTSLTSIALPKLKDPGEQGSLVVSVRVDAPSLSSLDLGEMSAAQLVSIVIDNPSALSTIDLAKLQDVSTDLSVLLSPSPTAVGDLLMNQLTTVGGNLIVDAVPGTFPLSNLTTVGGSVTLLTGTYLGVCTDVARLCQGGFAGVLNTGGNCQPCQ